MAVNYMKRAGLAESSAGSAVRIAAAGRAAWETYRARVADQEDAGLRQALVGLPGRRDALVEGLRPPERAWRAERRYVAQTRRVLADPPASLPWQPMVLHRGGWPDGS